MVENKAIIIGRNDGEVETGMPATGMTRACIPTLVATDAQASLTAAPTDAGVAETGRAASAAEKPVIIASKYMISRVIMGFLLRSHSD